MAGRTLQITYVGDSSRVLAAQRSIDAGHTKMQSGLQKTGSFFQQAFGITAPLAAAAAVAGVVKLGSVVVNAAADQNEALNVVDKTFGRTQDTIKRFAETSATSFGISETAALEAAGGFGAMLKSAGITGQGLADMSTKVIGLAGDLASFKNVAPEEALEKLRSGLAGEAEPLRQFGVFLSEATVQAEAYKSGIAETGAELTEAQKIQARYQVILQQTADAHGDFAETLGESLPNQLRALRAELENVAADIGQTLLPVVLEVTQVLRATLGPALELVADNLGVVLGTAAGFAALRYLPPLLFQMALGLEAIGAASIAGGIANVAAGLAGIKAAVAVLPVAVLVAFAESTRKTSDELLAMDNAVLAVGRGSTNTSTQLEYLQERIRDEEQAFADAAVKAGLAEQGILNLGGTTAETAREFDKAGRDIHRFANMTSKDLREWRTDVKESFADYTAGVSLVGEETVITRNKIIIAFDRMEERARDLARAMREIKGEDWINERFVAFLSEQGPEWLIGFSKLTKEQQREAQEAWKTTTEKTDAAKDSLDRITGALGRLRGGESRHKVIIEYEYVGFDPTKPGMAGVQRSR